jgi:HSP20 family molecular chaperone IbpA
MSFFEPEPLYEDPLQMDPWSDIGLGFGDWSSFGMPSGSYFDPFFGLMAGVGRNAPPPTRSRRRKVSAQGQRAETNDTQQEQQKQPDQQQRQQPQPQQQSQQTQQTQQTQPQQPQQPQQAQPLHTEKPEDADQQKEQEQQPQQAQSAQQPQQAQQPAAAEDEEEEEASPVKRLAVRAHQRPTIDIHESEDEYCLVVDFPGVKKEDLKVTVSGNSLSITGERKVPKGIDVSGRANKSIRRAYGKFARSLQLPSRTPVRRIQQK